MCLIKEQKGENFIGVTLFFNEMLIFLAQMFFPHMKNFNIGQSPFAKKFKGLSMEMNLKISLCCAISFHAIYADDIVLNS